MQDTTQISNKEKSTEKLGNAKMKHIAKTLSIIGFVDLMGVSMIIPLMSNRIKNLGSTPIVHGLLGSTYGALQLLSSPAIGNWSDIQGRRHTLIFCLLVSAIGYLILSWPHVGVMLFARILSGLFKHSQSISQAFLADLQLADSTTYLGYFTASSNLGFILGPLLGGHVGEFEYGFPLVCLMVASLFILNSGIVWFYLPDISKSSNKVSKNNLSQGYWKQWKDLNFKSCWDILVMRFLLSFAALVYRSNFTLTLEQKFQLTPKHIGYIMSFQGFVAAVSGFLVGPISNFINNETSQLLIGSCIMLISLLGATLSTNIILLMCSLTLLSISTSVLRVCVMKVMISWSPSDKIGTVIGIGQSITSGARMLSPIIGSLALEVSANGAGMLSIVSAFFGTLLCFYMSSKKSKLKVS